MDAKVPPEARTAERKDAALINPPVPRVLRGLTTAVAATGVWAGSYQRSGVTGGVSSHDRAQSARGSGAGVYRSTGGLPASWAAELAVHGVIGSTIGAIGAAAGSVHAPGSAAGVPAAVASVESTV
jgi:hypothetical protein